MSNLEYILTQNQYDEKTLKELLGIHSSGFDVPMLSAQLRLLPTLGSHKTVPTIIEALREAGPTVRNMLSECVKLCKLVMAAPTSVATAERSFSHLRYIKSYLRSTMGHARLTHLMIIHLFRAQSRNLNKEEILKEFVSRCPQRKSVFGNCLK